MYTISGRLVGEPLRGSLLRAAVEGRPYISKAEDFNHSKDMISKLP